MIEQAEAASEATFDGVASVMDGSAGGLRVTGAMIRRSGNRERQSPRSSTTILSGSRP